MMITYRSRFLTRGEVWFDNEPDGTVRALDWLLYHQCARPLPGAQSRPFYSFVIDLTQSREELESRLQKDTAYKIRRARERDKIVCEGCDPSDPAVMAQFEQMYNSFATFKGLAPLDRARVGGLAGAGFFDLSVTRDAQGNPLVYHGNYRDPRRAAGLMLPSLYRAHSDSATRNFIGRANRYLTWSDILRYKDQGLRLFDFGGWYRGTDPGMLKINDFKKGFGGQVVREYDCERILSLRGWLVLTLATVLTRAKGLAARLRPHSLCPDAKSATEAETEAAGPPLTDPLAASSGSKPAV